MNAIPIRAVYRVLVSWNQLSGQTFFLRRISDASAMLLARPSQTNPKSIKPENVASESEQDLTGQS